jgi:dTDP-4-amino-4,6-dideoxygalactose transaminase
MIPINKPWIGDEEKAEVLKVLEENALTNPSYNGGKRVQEFESSLRNFLGSKHVIAVNSGTAAIHAALLAAHIQPGDEVLLPSFTFVATANAVVAARAKPVFVDIDRRDYTIDITDLKDKLTSKTKAVLPVHLYGHPCDMAGLGEIASKYSIAIIEDACQSLGSTYRKKQTGTFGLMGCFSLYASKVLTSGEGGAVATDSDDMAERLKMIRNHGMVEGYDTRIMGLNMRMPELCAAIAKVQMSKLQTMLERRRKNARMLSDQLANSNAVSRGLLQLPAEDEKKTFNWYLYTVAFNNNSNHSRDQIKQKLFDAGIGATVYYNPPVHKTPYYEKIVGNESLPNTNWAARQVLSLPAHPLLTAEDVRYIGDSLLKVLA